MEKEKISLPLVTEKEHKLLKVYENDLFDFSSQFSISLIKLFNYLIT